MAKKSLLLVDADPRSLRVLEVSLRKAGYSVATCRDAQSALETVDLSEPDLILSDTRLPGMNGFELVEELRKQDGNDAIPFMFLSSDSSVESKVRGLELGVEDYLTKPIYIKEIITRINLTLQRQEREGLAKRTSISKTRFTGSLGDMGLVDLLQTIDISRKSGVLELTGESGQRGSISFRDGQLVDAEMGRLAAENAIYRLLLWSEGEFEIDFRPVRVEPRITASTQAILMEGMRRIDEWGRLLEQIPSLDNVFEVSEEELVERLAEIPDEINHILRHIDGRRSLLQVVDAAGGDDLETLTAITKLYFEGIVYPTGRTVGAEAPIDENVLVGEEPLPEEEEADLAEADVPDLVPRAPTEPPPATLDVEAATDRAKADGGDAVAADDVPESASEPVPDPGADEGDPGQGAGGMEDADPIQTGSDLDPSLEVGDVDDDGSLDEEALPEEAEDEDGMARKGRRRRKRRAKAAEQAQEQGQQQAQAEESESANTVIQFPAQAKRGVATSQVAVNDDVVGGVDEDEAETEEAQADDTRTVKRDEAEAKAEPAAEEDAPSEAEAGPTIPDLAAEAKRALAEDEPEAEAKAEPADAEPAEAEPEAAEPEAAAEEEAKAEPADEEPEAKAAEPEPQKEEEAKAEEPPQEEAKAEPAEKAEDDGARGKRKKKKRKSKKARDREARKSEAPAAKAEPEKKDAEKPAAKAEPEKKAAAAKDGAKDSEKPRRKKKQTTTSAEIRAVTATGEHAEVAEDFFRSEQKVHQVEHETWDDLQKSELPISPGMKKAKYATFAILAAGFVLIGGYLVYQNVIMPQPVQLSGGAPPELPDSFEEEGGEAPVQEAAPEETPEEAPQEAAAVVAEGAGEEGEALTAEGEEEAAVEGEEEAVVEGEEGEAAAEGEAEEAVAEAEAPAEAEEPAEAEAPAASPADARRIARQALSALNRRRNEEAAQLAQQALAADNTVALGWLVLGAARQEMRDAAGAREAYQSCVDQGQGREVRDCRAMLR